MQHSSLALFCDECGLANDLTATHCSACQHLLIRASSMQQIAPVTVTPPLVREVMPGLLFTSDNQSTTSDIQPGTILAGCYQIKEEIGRGGFSIVYRAVELEDQKRQVAIKRIPLSTLTPGQIIDATETFNREITTLMRFSGTDGVPTFYGHLADQENWYLIMQYIEGETLEESLQKTSGGYFDEAKTIDIGIKLTQILQELHTDHPPVIFRDVKPANIMLTPEKKLFLIDFGIARNFTFGKAKDTTPLGSPGYAAPEQYGRAQTDRRTDIYGLGATLQTLVTGRDPLELAAGEASRNPQPLSSGLRTLLDEMLSPASDQRPVDMLHVQARLKSMQRPEVKLDPRFVPIVNFIVLLLALAFYVDLLLNANWQGAFFLAGLTIRGVVANKWFEKLPFIGPRTKIICLAIVNIILLLSVLLPLLLLIFKFTGLFLK